MTLTVATATMGQPKAQECMDSWGDVPIYRHDNREHNIGVLGAYQSLYQRSKLEADIIAFLHDDCVMRDPEWQARVLTEFADPKVGLVGFGGALQHGSTDLYRLPYHYTQLGRHGYRSNTDDAETHGSRFTGSCEVAVLDGFALIVRRALLDKMGGFRLDTPVGYSLYDYMLSCEAHRHGYRIRLVGVPCHHYGGMTAVGMGVAAGEGDAHERAHHYIYDTYRDVLPYCVREARHGP